MMENWEQQFERVQPPGSVVQSHRDSLRDKLKSGNVRPRPRVNRPLLVASLVAVLAFSGLTAAYTGWAEQIYRYVIVKKLRIQVNENTQMEIRSMLTDNVPGDSLCTRMVSEMDLPANAEIMLLDPDDPVAQSLTIDAEILAEGTLDESRKMFTIQSLDCGSTWVVNGDTVESEAAMLELRSEAELMQALSEIKEEQTATSTDEQPEAVTNFELHQNYPNPFNPTTQISFDLAEAGEVSLRVYNLTGQEVATLIDGHRSAGSHSITFDGRDLPSGAYIYILQAGDHKIAKTMQLVK